MTDTQEQTYVYIVRMNVNEDRRHEFDEWYVRLHGPDVVLKVPGFVEARSYRTSTGPQRILSIYDITDPVILGTPEYHQMRADDPQGNDLRASGLSGSSLGIYSEMARSPRTLGGGRRELPRFTTAYVTTMRFNLVDATAADALIAWFGEHGPDLSPADSALGSYLCRRSGEHPAAPSKEPEWVLVTDWVTHNGVATTPDAVVAQMSQVAGEMSDVIFDLGRRVYTYRGGI